MTWRRLVVMLLGIGLIAYSALTAFELYSPSLTPFSVGFQTEVHQGRLVVTAVPQYDRRGQPNPISRTGLRVDDRVEAVYNREGRGRRIASAADFGMGLSRIGRDEPWTLVVVPDRGPAPWRMPSPP